MKIFMFDLPATQSLNPICPGGLLEKTVIPSHTVTEEYGLIILVNNPRMIFWSK